MRQATQVAVAAAATIPIVSPKGYSVLIVDDHPQAQVVLTRLLTHMGYRVEIAENGLEAVESVLRSPPDIVLMDVVMPVMDGYEATARIRAEAKGPWLPIVFLSATSETASLIEALERGADDYLVKPITAGLLEAKMHAVSRMLDLQRALEDSNRRLEAYRAAEDEQNRSAQHVIQRLSNHDLIEESVLQHWGAPASLFSGDLVAAARSPSGALKVMLADGAGHGLAAALTALPVIPPFYSMAQKGFNLSSIIQEINHKVRTILPAERFVAATFMAVDFSERVIKVWNGGTPPVCVIDQHGKILHMGCSRNLALGVADDRLFSGEPELYRYEEPCQIVACSDGLLEGAGLPATSAGMRDLIKMIASFAPEARLAALQSLCVPNEGHAPVDDMTAVLIACAPGQLPLRAVACQGPSLSSNAGEWYVNTRLTAEQLKHVDIVPLLQDIVGGMGRTCLRNPKVFLVLSELVSNALDHGVLGLDSRTKLEPDGFMRYEQVRQERLGSLASSHLDVRVAGAYAEGRQMLRISIKDSGAGFDFRSVLDSKPGLDIPYGRGIALLKQVCESIEYLGCGNEVEVLFAI